VCSRSRGRRVLRRLVGERVLRPQETAQDGIARKTLGSPLSGFLFAYLDDFAQQTFLNLRLHCDTVECLFGFHKVTISKGE